MHMGAHVHIPYSPLLSFSASIFLASFVMFTGRRDRDVLIKVGYFTVKSVCSFPLV